MEKSVGGKNILEALTREHQNHRERQLKQRWFDLGPRVSDTAGLALSTLASYLRTLTSIGSNHPIQTRCQSPPVRSRERVTLAVINQADLVAALHSLITVSGGCLQPAQGCAP